MKTMNVELQHNGWLFKALVCYLLHRKVGYSTSNGESQSAGWAVIAWMGKIHAGTPDGRSRKNIWQIKRQSSTFL